MSETPKARQTPRYSNLGKARATDAGRLSIALNEEAVENLDRLRQIYGGETNTGIIRRALAAQRVALEGKTSNSEQGQLPQREEERTVRLSLSRNRAEIIRQSDILIVALQEALDYDPVRHHNSGPPPFWEDDRKYLAAIEALTKELRRLSGLLESKPVGIGTSRVAQIVGNQINNFAKAFMPVFGKGAAGLLLVVMADMLGKMGIGTNEIDVAVAAFIVGRKKA